MDTETKQVLSEGEELKAMTESKGWTIARQKIADKIMDLQFIANVDDSDATKALIDMKARKYAVAILWEWLKSDIEGTVEQHINNNNLEKPLNSYIVREAQVYPPSPQEGISVER